MPPAQLIVVRTDLLRRRLTLGREESAVARAAAEVTVRSSPLPMPAEQSDRPTAGKCVRGRFSNGRSVASISFLPLPTPRNRRQGCLSFVPLLIIPCPSLTFSQNVKWTMRGGG